MGKKFDRLSEHITKEYEAKGVAPEKARYIGRATAGEVANKKDKDGGDKKDE